VKNTPITKYDDHGLGTDPDNLAAVGSLIGYRTLKWGRNVDLIITDQHSFRSEEPTSRAEAEAFASRDWLDFYPQEAMEILDAGRAWNGGKPPDTIRYGDQQVANFRKNEPPQTVLGAEQKAWFIDQLKRSKATWKVWGNTAGTLDYRADPQNLPEGVASKPWPGAGYAGFGGGDHSGAYVERGEIYDIVRSAGITGFVTVAGDRHSFWAGLAAKSLPPQPFEPVGVAFVTGSLSAPGLVEACEHNLKKDHPLRALYLIERPGDEHPQPAVNLLMRHGVRACLEYQKSGDIERARKLSNPDLSPHLSFIDMGGHGYATVRASSTSIQTEFVCIPRPLERSQEPDGGPLRYRVVHTARLWSRGEQPKLEQHVLEGNPILSL
jgi:alkaline phosphatase D